MIRYVKLKNYKSLVDLSVDFMETKNKPKKFAAIYGENGVGKSNFASCFFFLNETMSTMSSVEEWNKIQTMAEGESDNKYFKEIFDKMKNSFKSTKMIIKEYKTIDSKENMSLELGFQIKGKNGSYKIEYNNDEIVLEKLEYVLNKKQSCFINITSENKDISKSIFIDNAYYKELMDLTDKYWGKHSFLSIINHEIKDKKRNYVKERITSSFYESFDFLKSIYNRVIGANNLEYGKVLIKHGLPKDMKKGSLSMKDEKLLDNAEYFINYFFTRLYADIKKVYYKREIASDKINYELMVKKNVYNKIIDVSFEKESTGTNNILKLIPYFISACEGKTVIIDEIDKGIHDLLINKLIDNIIDYIKGQLIITTHNTLLIESRIPNKDIYVFNVNKNAEKELIPITDFNGRIPKNINPRKRYLLGMYGGIPYMQDIDFDELIESIE